MASAEAQAAAPEGDTELPKALVKRIIKQKLASIHAGANADKKGDVQLNKDALLAFSESARVFISFLTATASDVCKEHKRQTIGVEDVFTALEELDFGEMVAPLREELAAFKAGTAEKNKERAEQAGRKRKEREEMKRQQEAQQGEQGQKDQEQEQEEQLLQEEGGEEAQEEEPEVGNDGEGVEEAGGDDGASDEGAEEEPTAEAMDT